MTVFKMTAWLLVCWTIADDARATRAGYDDCKEEGEGLRVNALFVGQLRMITIAQRIAFSARMGTHAERVDKLPLLEGG